MVPPTMEYYGSVDSVITRYPYDLPRAVQLLDQAGLTRDRDGLLVNSLGERFSPELRGTSAGQEERETAIVADNWRRAGVDVHVRLTSEAEDRDRETRSTFPAFQGRGTDLEESSALGKLFGGNSAGPANRWLGANRGGWINPQYDAFYDTLMTNLVQAERTGAIVQAMKLLSEELPVFPLYYNYVVQAHVAALTGPAPYAPGADRTWNVHQWEMR